MKKIMLIVVAISIFALISCRHREEYDFLNPKNEIDKIMIVHLSFSDENEMTETILNEIDDLTKFIDDFEDVPCYTYFGDPAGVTEEGTEATVIKILYKNKDYELINWNGQAEYTTRGGLDYYSGFCVFDESQFSSLIATYLPCF